MTRKRTRRWGGVALDSRFRGNDEVGGAPVFAVLLGTPLARPLGSGFRRSGVVVTGRGWKTSPIVIIRLDRMIQYPAEWVFETRNAHVDS